MDKMLVFYTRDMVSITVEGIGISGYLTRVWVLVHPLVTLRGLGENYVGLV